jgi:hypothetical protein
VTLLLRHKRFTHGLTICAASMALAISTLCGCSGLMHTSGTLDGAWDNDADESTESTDAVNDGSREADEGGEVIDVGDEDVGEADTGDQDPGDAGVIVEYRACGDDGDISDIWLWRIDRTNSICTMASIEENFGSCRSLGLVSEDGYWCLIRASMGSDIAACEAWHTPGDGVNATAATGTFTIGHLTDIDVEFQFPSGTGLPETVHFQVTNCADNCEPEDCRR